MIIIYNFKIIYVRELLLVVVVLVLVLVLVLLVLVLVDLVL